MRVLATPSQDFATPHSLELFPQVEVNNHGPRSVSAKMNASTPADAAFGPQLKGSFDFTLAFEQSIFSIAPSALLLVVVPIRLALLARKGTRAAVRNSTLLLWLKLVCSSRTLLSPRPKLSRY